MFKLINDQIAQNPIAIPAHLIALVTILSALSLVNVVTIL